MKKTELLTYREELSQTESQVAVELLDDKIASAQNEFDMGMLSVKSKILAAQSELKKSQALVSSAELALKKANRSEPKDLVQNLINAFQNVKQAEIDVTVSESKVKDLQEIYNFLEERKQVLFG